MIIAVVCLSFLALALVAALTFIDRANRRERQELVDRIQVPEVAQAAAFARALPQQPLLPDTDVEDDKAFGRPLDDLDFDFTPVTGDA